MCESMGLVACYAFSCKGTLEVVTLEETGRCSFVVGKTIENAALGW